MGILAILTLANVLNYYDRAIPAIIVERLKAEFGLSDSDVGLIGASFALVYGAAGIFLGRLADRGSRRKVMAFGMISWSLATALCGGAWSLTSMVAFRLGVGIGEASYAPAAHALLFDTFHPDRRSRAVSILQLGIPGGLLLAFLSVGPLVEATGSWRIPFVLAALPGFVLAVVLLRLPMPEAGAADDEEPKDYTARNTLDAVRHLLAIPTVRWITVSAVGTQVATFAVVTFLVPLLQRYFRMPLGEASMTSGVIAGVAGVIGLLLGGHLADRASRHSPRARLLVGVAGVAVGAPIITAALLVPSDQPVAFAVILGLGCLVNYFMTTAWVPAIADVVEPHLRATAVALNLAVGYVLGAAGGPYLTGRLSDWLARVGGSSSTAVAPLTPEAIGLHRALLIVVPTALVAAALAGWLASRSIAADHARLLVEAPTAEAPTADALNADAAEADLPPRIPQRSDPAAR